MRPEELISKENVTDPIGNRNRDLPDCSAVSQGTAPSLTLQVFV